MNAEKASKSDEMRWPDPDPESGKKADTTGDEQKMHSVAARGSGDSMYTRKAHCTTKPHDVVSDDQPEAAEEGPGVMG